MTRLWIPFGVIVIWILPIGMMCHADIRPLLVNNDTAAVVKFEFWSPLQRGRAPEKWDAPPLKPGAGFGIPFCSKDEEFALLSTVSHPEPVAYRIKDLCDLDDCSCEIKVSDLERRRKEISVPWVPPAAR